MNLFSCNLNNLKSGYTVTSDASVHPSPSVFTRITQKLAGQKVDNKELYNKLRESLSAPRQPDEMHNFEGNIDQLCEKGYLTSLQAVALKALIASKQKS